MCYKSPSKILRSARRLTKFIENQPDILSVTMLPPINIMPAPKPLKISQPVNVDIYPEKKNLSLAFVSSTSIPPPKPIHISCRKFQSTEIVPGAKNEDRLFFSSYINGATFSTTFVCHICYDDFSFKSANAMRRHIQSVHYHEMSIKMKTPFSAIIEEFDWYHHSTTNLSSLIFSISPTLTSPLFPLFHIFKGFSQENNKIVVIWKSLLWLFDYK